MSVPNVKRCRRDMHNMSIYQGELGTQFRIMTYKRQRKICEYRGHYRKENLSLKFFILMEFLKFVIKFEVKKILGGGR